MEKTGPVTDVAEIQKINKAAAQQEVMEKFGKIVVETMTQLQKEKEDKEGLYFVDIIRTIRSKEQTDNAVALLFQVDTVMLNMYLNGKLYGNHDFTQYSLIPLEGYSLWKDALAAKHQHFELVGTQTILPTTAPLHNLKSLHAMFLAKADESDPKQAEFAETFNKYGPCYLDGEDVDHLLIATYPRSGSTLNRKYFETITGTVTGSCYANDRLLKFQLTVQGFRGESIVDNRVWGQRSHYPLKQSTFNIPTESSKAIVCVRNPYDIAVSVNQLFLTYTYNLSTANVIHEEFPDYWDMT